MLSTIITVVVVVLQYFVTNAAAAAMTARKAMLSKGEAITAGIDHEKRS
jgi:hypothetical protein